MIGTGLRVSTTLRPSRDVFVVVAVAPRAYITCIHLGAQQPATRSSSFCIAMVRWRRAACTVFVGRIMCGKTPIWCTVPGVTSTIGNDYGMHGQDHPSPTPPSLNYSCYRVHRWPTDLPAVSVGACPVVEEQLRFLVPLSSRRTLSVHVGRPLLNPSGKRPVRIGGPFDNLPGSCCGAGYEQVR